MVDPKLAAIDRQLTALTNMLHRWQTIGQAAIPLAEVYREIDILLMERHELQAELRHPDDTASISGWGHMGIVEHPPPADVHGEPA
jgi:hypothetical protein